MADVTIDGSAYGSMEQQGQPRSLVWVSPTVGYLFYVDSSTDLQYNKTTNGGSSWGTATTIKTGTNKKFAIWYDKWTSGDSGTQIHIAFVDTSGGILYNALDTSDDSLQGEVTAVSGSTTSSIDWTYHGVSVVVSRGGNIFVGGWTSSSGQHGFAKSTNGGSSFTSKTSMADDSAVDRIMFLPGSEVDDDDIWCFYYDVSADALTIKTYDDSGDSWSESSTITTGQIETGRFNFDVAERFSDNHAILVLWNEENSSTADLECWDITDTSTFTQKTNILTNSDGNYGICGLMINQQNDDLYVAYTIGDTGGSIKYKKSTDGGGTWGTQQDFSDTSDDHRLICGGTSIGDDGGRWSPCWFNDDLNDMITNYSNSVEISVSANKTLTPSAQSLTLTQGSASTTITHLETPTAQSLSLSQESITVVISENQQSTAQSMSLSLETPTVIVTDAFNPNTLTLSLTLETPDVSSDSNKTLTPSTLSITGACPAPSLKTDDSISPSPNTLALTLESPSTLIEMDVALSPSALSLSLSDLEPSTTQQTYVFPEAQTITTSQETPTPIISSSVSLDAQGMSLSLEDPTTTTGETVGLSAQTLSLSQETLTLEINTNQTPPEQTMTITVKTPSIIVSEDNTLSSLTLSLSQGEPTILKQKTSTPNTQSLALSQESITISSVTNATVSPSVLSLSCSHKVPTTSLGIVSSYYTSRIVYCNDENIESAVLTAAASSGSINLTYYLSNDDGETWESTTPGQVHYFSSTGTKLRYKITSFGSAELNFVEVKKQ